MVCFQSHCTDLKDHLYKAKTQGPICICIATYSNKHYQTFSFDICQLNRSIYRSIKLEPPFCTTPSITGPGGSSGSLGCKAPNPEDLGSEFLDKIATLHGRDFCHKNASASDLLFTFCCFFVFCRFFLFPHLSGEGC